MPRARVRTAVVRCRGCRRAKHQLAPTFPVTLRCTRYACSPQTHMTTDQPCIVEKPKGLSHAEKSSTDGERELPGMAEHRGGSRSQARTRALPRVLRAPAAAHVLGKRGEQGGQRPPRSPLRFTLVPQVSIWGLAPASKCRKTTPAPWLSLTRDLRAGCMYCGRANERLMSCFFGRCACFALKKTAPAEATPDAGGEAGFMWAMKVKQGFKCRVYKTPECRAEEVI